jgi:hypothetical protein
MPALMPLVASMLRLQISALRETNLGRINLQKHVEVVPQTRVRRLVVSHIQAAMLIRRGCAGLSTTYWVVKTRESGDKNYT